MMPVDLSYHFPQGVYLLLLMIPLFFAFYSLYRHRQKILNRYSEEPTLHKLLLQQSPIAYWLSTFLLLGSFVFAVIAFMQPKGNERYPDSVSFKQPEREEGEKAVLRYRAHDVIFLIDASSSMAVTDVWLGKSRFDYAKELADELISGLKGESASLYAFTSDAFKISPPTLDYLFVRLGLKQMQINEGGTAGTDLTKALDRVRKDNYAEASSRLKTVIILSDGGDNQIEDAPKEEKEVLIGKLLNTLKNSETLRLRVFTVGIGSKKGGIIPQFDVKGETVASRLDDKLLKRISQSARGYYFEAESMPLVEIANRLLSDMRQDDPFIDPSEDKQELTLETQYKIYTYYFWIPLSASIVLLISAMFGPDFIFSIIARKNGYFAFLIIFLLHSDLSAELPPYAYAQVQEAFNNNQAGNYAKAIGLYESLFEFPLNSFERSALLYNIGTAYLGYSEYLKAIDSYDKALQLNPPALVLSRLYRNKGISLYLQAKEIRSKLKDSSPLEEYRRAIHLLNASLTQANLAEKSECNLYKEEGGGTCNAQWNNDMFYRAVKQELSALFLMSTEAMSKTADLKKGLLEVSLSLDLILGNLKVLDSLPSDLEQSYRSEFRREADSWTILWARLKDKFGKQKKLLEIYEEAFDHYTAALKKLESNDRESSLSNILEAKKRIDQLENAIWEGLPLEALVSRLLLAYDIALRGEEINPSSLSLLKEEQERFFKRAKELKGEAKIKSEFLEELANGLNDAVKSDPLVQRLFLMKGKRLLQQMLFDLDEANSLNPELVLKNAIDGQQSALDINILWNELNARSKKETVKLPEETQTHVLKTALTFIPSVKAAQEKAFHAPYLVGQADERCQCSPWNVALPLYFSGLKEATKAKEEHLSQLMIPGQLKAIRDWTEALNKMKEKKPEEEQKEQETETSQDLLRKLEEMEKADLLPRPKPKAIQEGIKPW